MSLSGALAAFGVMDAAPISMAWGWGGSRTWVQHPKGSWLGLSGAEGAAGTGHGFLPPSPQPSCWDLSALRRLFLPRNNAPKVETSLFRHRVCPKWEHELRVTAFRGMGASAAGGGTAPGPTRGCGTLLRVPAAGLSALGATGWAQDWLGTPNPWWLEQAHTGLV